jgi:hypothetical protein
MTMDSPIEKKALFAQTRVQQALEAGAHYIDADDVRDALDGLKGALDCQFGVHNDLLARIADMEVKLAASNSVATQPEQQQESGLASSESIDELAAYEAWCRVKGLAESGATPQIDARDVLGALVFCGRENKALLEKKTSAGRAYQNHIAWLGDQLAKARASTGGSRELVAAAISIRDRLVDYFRYVAEGLPLERQAEANERAQALINALGLLANDLEAGRLADQCTRLHRNQLLGELDEARAALDASQGQVKQLEAEVAELRGLADMLRLTGALK